MIEDVLAFRRKFGQLVSTEPVHLTKRRLAERANFLLEELEEFAHGAGLIMEGGRYVICEEVDQDLAAQADGLIDIVYVALGTAIMLGLPWHALWDDVQRANMNKELGPTGDVVKPRGWKPPRGEDILREHGYDRERFRFRSLWGLIDDSRCIDDPEHSR